MQQSPSWEANSCSLVTEFSTVYVPVCTAAGMNPARPHTNPSHCIPPENTCNGGPLLLDLFNTELPNTCMCAATCFGVIYAIFRELTPKFESHYNIIY